MRKLWLTLLSSGLLVACSDGGLSVAPTTTASPEPGVVVAAAGDISCPRSLACTDTSQLIAAIDPEAVLALGDIQYERGELVDFNEVYGKTWGRFKDITFPSPGNHEYSTPRAAGYFAYFGVEPWYSVDIGDWHVISLNSNCRSIGGCHAGSPQEKWLRADLAAHPAKCTLAFWHHPRWSSGYHGSDAGYEPLWAALSDAGADVVLGGHDHNYERFAPDRGIRQFVVGTGGRSLYPVLGRERGTEVINDDTYGVLKLTLRASGYEWEFVAAGASKFTDAGQAECS